MPDFQDTARDAYSLYLSNRRRAVQGGGFIARFQEFCIRELNRGGLPPTGTVAPPRSGVVLGLEKEVNILGGYVDKRVDLTFQSSTSGPLLAVSLKSQMSSITDNKKNRFEEYIGDATNLHSRFPLLVLGFLMILPYSVYDSDGNIKERIIDANGLPTATAQMIFNMLRGATGRTESTSLPGTYEEAGLAVLDFTANPVTLHPTFPPTGQSPSLRLEDFFERLIARYQQRNTYL